jgi:hypothetical protein
VPSRIICAKHYGVPQSKARAEKFASRLIQLAPFISNGPGRPQVWSLSTECMIVSRTRTLSRLRTNSDRFSAHVDPGNDREGPLSKGNRVWGFADLVFAFYKGARVNLEPGALGAGFYIVTAIVPPLLVSHALIFELLMRSG